MIHGPIFVIAAALGLSAASVNALPLNKRIAQVIADSTPLWEKACDAAGGGLQCNPVAVAAFDTLLANAGDCDQQNSADTMIDLAHQLNNDPDMIKFAQLFAQQPRNSPNSVSIPYCQQAPKNAELNGLYQCQWVGDAATFVGGLTVPQTGTIPFGLSAPVNGSCPANPSGPIANGVQLTSITQDPGLANIPQGGATSSSSSTGSASSASSGNTGTSSSASSASTETSSSATSIATASTTSSSSTATASSTSTSSAGGGTSSFALANGQAAQQLNAKFSTLTASSSCTSGENACVNGDFAQCVNGAFVTTPCSASLQCYALPLVNSAGTSIACDTQADAQTRIANTGATGGITGSD